MFRCGGVEEDAGNAGLIEDCRDPSTALSAASRTTTPLRMTRELGRWWPGEPYKLSAILSAGEWKDPYSLFCPRYAGLIDM
jgi:hypothetical protein